MMRQRPAMAKGAQARPQAARSMGAVHQQHQNQVPQMQQMNSQQLAQVVGPQEASCLMKPLNQVIMQPKVNVVNVPVNFVQMFHTTELVNVQAIPEVTYMQQPAAQVQLNTCLQQPVAMAAPCGPCQEDIGCGSSCDQGSYQSGPYAAPYAAAAAYPYTYPYAAAAALDAPYQAAALATAATLGYGGYY